MSVSKFDRSFTAMLFCVNLQSKPQQVVMTTSDLQTIGPGSGWLSLPEISSKIESRDLIMRFDFIEKTEDRFHYKVSCVGSSHDGNYLDTSRNGFLGFYDSVAGDVFWKIEEVGVFHGDRGDMPCFHLRDKHGHLVRQEFSTKSKSRYLNIEGNHEPLQFVLSHYRPL